MAFHGGSGGSFGNVPPVGTSARAGFFGNFFGKLQDIMNGAGNVIQPSVDGNIHPEANAPNLGNESYIPHDETLNGLQDTNSGKVLFNRPKGLPPSHGSGSVPVFSQPQTFDYLDAPWASAYGMSKETAYSEAMENTAYRRSVTDMQAAGLNPAVIFGAGNGYTAGSPNYIASASFGSGSGSGSRRYRGSSRPGGRLFSSSAYSVMSALGGIVGAAATKSPGGYWLGVSLTQGAMSALDYFYRR